MVSKLVGSSPTQGHLAPQGAGPWNKRRVGLLTTRLYARKIKNFWRRYNGGKEKDKSSGPA